MKVAMTTALMLVRFTGLLQILLGLAFWTGNALGLIPVHMLIGLLFVLSLWTLAVLAIFAGAHRGFVALAIVWGAIVVVFGVTQTQILPGAFHWVIQILHLAVGMAAMWMGEQLARMAKSRREETTPALQT